MAAITAIIGPKFGHHQDRVEQPKRRTSSSSNFLHITQPTTLLSKLLRMEFMINHE